MSTGRSAALDGAWTASSLAPVSSGYERSLRPCHAPPIAPHRRVSQSDSDSYGTTVGMSLIFPETISARILSTAATSACGTFGLIFPSPTPFCFSP